MKVADYLDWASGNKEFEDLGVLVLPLIQRSSVWKPKQIIDLWDTILRGMPMGCLLEQSLATVDNSTPMYVDLKTRELKTLEGKGIALLDGQQRTLTMLLGWPFEERPDHRLWVDLADNPQGSHLFRLRVTTKNQPFGFQKSSSTKLSLSDRTKAYEEYYKHESNTNKDSSEDIFNKAKPHRSKAAIDLHLIIEQWKKGNKVDWRDWLRKRIVESSSEELNADDIDGKINLFSEALDRLFSMEIPIVKVNDSHMDDGDTDEQDPPLAILFKRIGTGGTTLSDEDYVYSIIKHRIPPAYGLVETLHNKKSIASLLSSTDLVMTAVRLLADTLGNTTNFESPTKKQFHTLLKNKSFKSEFKELIEGKVLETAFSQLTNLIKYKKNENEIGLPLQAFPQLKRPLIQVLIKWIYDLKDNDGVERILNDNQERVIRFVLYWQIAVKNPKKASNMVFNRLSKGSHADFPDKEIYELLIKDYKLALPIVSPQFMAEKRLSMVRHNIDSGSKEILTGWKRFEVKKEDILSDEIRGAVELYQRWWGYGQYVHPILLWLQRDLVDQWESGNDNPLAGRDEDTFYDYDHISPQSNWSNWRGAIGDDRLIDFKVSGDDSGHYRTGNSIGNVRVWCSSENRSDGDASPETKLFGNSEKPMLKDDSSKRLKDSVINPEDKKFWIGCSNAEKRKWDSKRVKAFQCAIEERAFYLYSKYYNDLKFVKWLGD